MTYDELKQHAAGFTTLDGEGRVMRFTNYPIQVAPLRDKKRIASEAVFVNPSATPESNMHWALTAGVVLANRGYTVDVARGEFLDLEPYPEPAAFVHVWKDIDADVIDEEITNKIGAEMTKIIESLGGDNSADLPGVIHPDYEMPWFRGFGAAPSQVWDRHGLAGELVLVRRRILKKRTEG